MPRPAQLLRGLRKAKGHSHSALGFMAHWQHPQCNCSMPSTETTQPLHSHLFVLKAIQLVWRSYMSVQVSAADPPASTRPRPQHKLHIVCFVKFNSNVSTHMHTPDLHIHIWRAAALLTSEVQAATHWLQGKLYLFLRHRNVYNISAELVKIPTTEISPLFPTITLWKGEHLTFWTFFQALNKWSDFQQHSLSESCEYFVIITIKIIIKVLTICFDT